jgi:cell division protein ZapA
MAQVNLTVNGRPFAVTCDDGQEARIGQVGEARLLLLAALVIADELADANEGLRQERNGVHDAAASAAVDAAANGIHGLAQRVEAIAARLETS